MSLRSIAPSLRRRYRDLLNSMKNVLGCRLETPTPISPYPRGPICPASVTRCASYSVVARLRAGGSGSGLLIGGSRRATRKTPSRSIDQLSVERA